jgi:hypothetical protein
VRAETARAIVEAYESGGVAAFEQLRRVGEQLDEPSRLAFDVRRALPGAAATNRLIADLVLRLDSTGLQITRWALDAYREVIAAGVAPDVLSGTQTRYVAMQRAWSRLLDRGVTGFVDRAGRNWSLSSYVEMASRTTVARAATAGRLDQFAAQGITLVSVSDHAHECRLCRPWERRILATSGPDGGRTVEMRNEVTGGIGRVEISGTVDEAMRAGLLHPNCEHGLNPYIHGATVLPKPEPDPEGDAARQRQRALERRIRSLKARQNAIIDPTQGPRLASALRATQAELREHLRAANAKGLTLLRRRYRERPDLGFTRK